MKKLLCLIVTGFISIPGITQSIEELEKEFHTCDDKWDTKLQAAQKLLEADPLHFDAIRYFIQYYSILGPKDSVPLFFDSLRKKHPQSALPYLYRIQLDDYIRLTPAQRLNDLRQGHSLEPGNREINYQLGKHYYTCFRQEYSRKRRKIRLDRYAELAIGYFEKLSGRRCVSPRTWAPLVQLYDYRKDLPRMQELKAQNFCEPIYFPLLAQCTDLQPTPAGRLSPAFGWESDYTVDMVWQTEYDLFIIDWYTRHLRSMKEPVLYGPVNADVIRFTWLGTFDRPLSVRIEHKRFRTTLFGKLTDGQGGYEAGNLIVDKKESIRFITWLRIKSHLKKRGFWEMPSTVEQYGADGSQWILEANIEGRYHFVDRWCGEGIKDLCMEIFRLADLGLVAMD